MKRKDKEDIALNIIGIISAMAALFFMSSLFLITSCSDDTFILGYNKDLEEIHHQIFEVDSLLRTINMEVDSVNAKI
tara:strand:+ start:1708 stop:1938 length:231 start_codon:yes stop_codon:yes gene_type:complete